MSYEDTIRVADLKTRGARMARVRGEVRAKPGQLLGVTEFMHPRLREICEVMPASIGRRLLASRSLNRLLAPLFANGRHVETTTHRMVPAAADLRRNAAVSPAKPQICRGAGTHRRLAGHDRGMRRSGTWILRSKSSVARPSSRGMAIPSTAGLRNFLTLTNLAPGLAAHQLHDLRQAALADDNGAALVRRRFGA